MAMITDEELRKALQWYVGRNCRKPTERSVFETWVIGHFHSYPKAAREITERMVELELVKVRKGIVEIL